MLMLRWLLIGKRWPVLFPGRPIFNSFFRFGVLILSIDNNRLESLRNSLAVYSGIVKNQYFSLLEFLSFHTFFIVEILPELFDKYMKVIYG